MVEKIKVLPEDLAASATVIHDVGDLFTQDFEDLKAANDALVANWSGSGSDTVALVADLSNWYMETLGKLAVIESMNINMAVKTFTGTDSNLSSAIEDAQKREV